MTSQSDLKNIQPSLTVLSWCGVISLIVVGHDNRYVYLYLTGAIIFTLLTNSIAQKLFINRTLPYDFVVYHFILTLALTLATFISTLRLAPYHRVICLLLFPFAIHFREFSVCNPLLSLLTCYLI